jgi:hydroxylaminobenzene mutase
MSGPNQARRGLRLLQYGVLLFLLGLLVGLAGPLLANPRMGLASHLEGVTNGLFLIALGVIWPRLVWSPRMEVVTYGLALYGTFANLVATGIAAVWGAGAPMMPIAGQGLVGSPVQEAVIRVLLVSLALADIAVCLLVLIGLRRARAAVE